MAKNKTSTKSAKDDEKNVSRAVFDKLVPAQRGDIYKVTSMGVVVEFSDKFTSAQSAYQTAPAPKSLYKIKKSGHSEKIYETLM